MKNWVNIKGIDVFAYHGCSQEEATLGGKFTVDIAMETDFSRTAITDDLRDTVDYVRVREIILEQMAIRSNLIEHVGYRIVEQVKREFIKIIQCNVTVKKLNAPIGGVVDYVSITIKG